MARAGCCARVAGDAAQVQIMYGCAGERRSTEWEVPWLAGYEGSTGARRQCGGRAAAARHLRRGHRCAATRRDQRPAPTTRRDWTLQRRAAASISRRIWEQPDEGIWEVRGGRQHFTYSKVMAWVAFDRAIKAVEQYGLEGPVDAVARACASRFMLRSAARLTTPSSARFVQSYGSKELDASLLLMPLVGFLPPSDPRVRGTVEAIEQRPDGRRLRAALRHTTPPTTVYPATKAHSSPVVSGSPTTACCSAAREDAERCSNGCCALRNDVGLLVGGVSIRVPSA